MSLFSFFSGKTVETHERKGDEHAASGDWGRAKIAYESGLDKLEKHPSADDGTKNRLEGKITRSREGLAVQHRRDAAELIQSGALPEARELVLLALELSADPELRSELERLLEDIEQHLDVEVEAERPILSYEEPDETEVFEETEDEYFMALCGALPEEVQQAYLSYGENFATGYRALNDGDFETAADYLSRAMKENPSPDSYIPLELATAFLNLEKRKEARELLETVVERHPGALPAHQMLCEIYWEDGEFVRAETHLAELPPQLRESVAVYLLKGETRFQAGDYAGAKMIFRRFLETYGWNEGISRSLARVHEAQKEIPEARNLYGEMMARCSGCGSRVDPEIKQKFADLSFAAGEHTTRLLELYLSLAREVPLIAADCYDKVSRIYAAQGNTKEERRFRAFAARAGDKR